MWRVVVRPRTRRRLATAFLVFGLLAGSETASAQKYKPDDAIPLGSQGKVLPISGKVTEVRGLALGVAGKTQALNAVLRDLRARSTDTEIRIELSSDVLFDFDKADLRPEAVPSLEKVATVLRSYPNSSGSIEGHTDGKGTQPYNQKLSERRAESVKNWLTSHGASNPLSTRGWGATKPVAPNVRPGGGDNPQGRQKNRRVEIVVKKR